MDDNDDDDDKSLLNLLDRNSYLLEIWGRKKKMRKILEEKKFT